MYIILLSHVCLLQDFIRPTSDIRLYIHPEAVYDILDAIK